MSDDQLYRRRWRDYRTPSGNRPARDFLATLPEAEKKVVLAAMKRVTIHGLAKARHLRDDIYEVRAISDTHAYRILFATEGHFPVW